MIWWTPTVRRTDSSSLCCHRNAIIATTTTIQFSTTIMTHATRSTVTIPDTSRDIAPPPPTSKQAHGQRQRRTQSIPAIVLIASIPSAIGTSTTIIGRLRCIGDPVIRRVFPSHRMQPAFAMITQTTSNANGDVCRRHSMPTIPLPITCRRRKDIAWSGRTDRTTDCRTRRGNPERNIANIGSRISSAISQTASSVRNGNAERPLNRAQPVRRRPVHRRRRRRPHRRQRQHPLPTP